MTPTVVNVAFLASITVLSYTVPASAYLDPGTGSMMLQALLAGVAGAAVVGRLYWHRVKSFLTSRFSAKRRNGPEQ